MCSASSISSHSSLSRRKELGLGSGCDGEELCFIEADNGVVRDSSVFLPDYLGLQRWVCLQYSSCHALDSTPGKVPLRISCKAEDTIGSKRRGRRGGRKDPMMDEQEYVWPYLETQERMIVDLNKQILVDTENLLARSNNKFGLVLEIAEEANEYLRHNKDEALTRKPILKVISDRINEGAGEIIRDSYCEETLDPQE